MAKAIGVSREVYAQLKALPRGGSLEIKLDLHSRPRTVHFVRNSAAAIKCEVVYLETRRDRKGQKNCRERVKVIKK